MVLMLIMMIDSFIRIKGDLEAVVQPIEQCRSTYVGNKIGANMQQINAPTSAAARLPPHFANLH
jgi:hypothetical protein